MKELSRGLGVALLVIALTLTAVPNAWAESPSQPPGFPDSLSQLKSSAQGEIEINWDASTGIPDFILGKIPIDGLANVDADPKTKAKSFIRHYSKLFRIKDSDNELSLIGNTPDELGMIHLKFQQLYQGVKVYGNQLVVHLKNHTVTAVNGHYTPDISLSTAPDFSSQEAEQTALQDLGAKKAAVAPGKTELVVYNADDGSHLAWNISITADEPPGRWLYFVDAHTGGVIYKINTIENVLNRSTYTANYSTPLPGTLVVREAGPLPGADATAINAHNNLGVVYDYYKNTFGRDSYDNLGAAITSTVHFGSGYTNAFWDSAQLVFGDGDGVTFTAPLGNALDVVAHEFTHAVTQYSANLSYHNQSGALNESYSDVFASMVDGNWLIGETIYGQPPHFLRSLSDPPAGGQPDNVNDYLVTSDDQMGDYGSVHANDGIPNKVAYNLATAIGRDKTQRIWYRALTTYLTPNSDFEGARLASIAAAIDLYGPSSGERTAVNNAFAAVGITSSLFESPHPYANDYDNTWIITNPDPTATATKVHFSAFSTETGADVVTIKDGSDVVVDQISGKHPDYISKPVPGRTVKVQFTSNASNQYWGFTLDRIVTANRAPGSISSYLPAIMDNAYGGWTTGANLRNPTASPAPATVVYYDGNGGVVGSDSQTIPGNGYWGIYQGGRFGGDWPGSAAIVSSAPVVATVNEVGPGNAAMGYSRETTPATTLYLPVVLDNAYGGWSSGINIKNTSTSPASVTISYYDGSGKPAGSDSGSLAGDGYWGVYQGGKFGGNWAGSAVISSSQPVVAIVNETSVSGSAISYEGFPSGGNSVFLPMMLDNAYGGWTTGANILNTSSSPASGSIFYYNGAGSLVKTQPISLPPRGYLGLYQGGAGLPAGFAGSAVITMNQPIAAVVNNVPISGDAMGYDGLVTGVTQVNLPVVMDNAYGGWTSGVGIQNTTSSPASVNVTYYGANGNLIGSASQSIPAHGYWGLYQGGALGGQAGSARITSTQPIAVVVNEINTSGSAISYTGTP